MAVPAAFLPQPLNPNPKPPLPLPQHLEEGEMEEGLGCSAGDSDLLCAEDGACLDGAGEEDDAGAGGLPFDGDSALSESEEEYLRLLVSSESSDGGASFSATSGPGESSAAAEAAEEWLKSARGGAVRWLLKTRAHFGFSLRTAYLAVIYFDRFLRRRTIDRGQSWAIQLLSVACLSLAAKMEECRVPALTEFPVDEHRFDAKAIQRMELLVLTTLEWRMSSVTPFPYLNYFASKLAGGDLGARGLFYRAIAFIFATIEGMNLMDYRPSAAAAAAIFAASGQALTRGLLEDKIRTISLFGSSELDQILSCYRVMIQESQKLQRVLKLVKFFIPPGLESSATQSTITRSSDDAIDDPHLSSASCKRRRLALSSHSCCCSVSNKNHSD